MALRTSEDEPPKPKEPPKPAHDKPIESKDAAKLFSAESWKKVQPVTDRLFKEKGTDFVIETMEKPPKGDPDKIKAMSADEKEKFFHDLVTERVKADKVQGIYIIICKSPTYLYVGTTGDVHFPSATASKIRQTLLSSLRKRSSTTRLAKCSTWR